MLARILLGSCLLLTSLSAAALPLRLMFEHVSNQGPGSELAFVTYDTSADLIAGNSSTSQFSQIDVNGVFNTTGFTYHGAEIVVMFEHIDNLGSGSELAFVTYNSYADLIAGNQSTSQFSQIDVAGVFNTTGITNDGDKLIVMFEHIDNLGSGSELAFVTYNSYADLIAGNQSTSQFSQIDVAGVFNTTGFAIQPDTVNVPEPSTLPLMLPALLALLAIRREVRRKRF